MRNLAELRALLSEENAFADVAFVELRVPLALGPGELVDFLLNTHDAICLSEAGRLELACRLRATFAELAGADGVVHYGMRMREITAVAS